jgi:hypothetical protein
MVATTRKPWPSRSYEVDVAEVRILISRLELACADLHIDNVRAKSNTEQH